VCVGYRARLPYGRHVGRADDAAAEPGWSKQGRAGELAARVVRLSTSLGSLGPRNTGPAARGTEADNTLGDKGAVFIASSNGATGRRAASGGGG
jgi:hypothetical protein